VLAVNIFKLMAENPLINRMLRIQIRLAIPMPIASIERVNPTLFALLRRANTAISKLTFELMI